MNPGHNRPIAYSESQRGAMAKRTLTREELAARAGVPLDALVALDEGRRGVTLSQLGLVAATLEVDEEALLDEPRRVATETRAREMIQRTRMHFVTPWEVAAFHLGNHRFIDKDLSEDLARRGSGGAVEAPKSGLTLPEVGAPPRVLLERVRRAWDETRITDGQARTALGLGPGDPLPFAR